MRKLLLLAILSAAAASCAEKVAPPLASTCRDVAAFTRAAGETKPKEELARLYMEHCALEETIALTTELVRFPTVSETESATSGPSFAAMRSHLEAWSQQAGLRFEVYGKNDAWEIHLGEGAPLVAFVMHADVVPVDPREWTVPAFEAKRDGNKLYGRGSEDDKGPIAAVLVMMRTLKRFGVELPGRVSAVMGNGEEHDWEGMISYAKEKQHAKYVISLDSSYPVVVAESGFVAWRLSAPATAKKKQK